MLFLIWPMASFSGGLPDSEILEYMQEYSCVDVPGFYNRPGQIDPSFVYGYANSKRDNVIFWCQADGSKRTYKLILHSRANNACAGVIFTTGNYPGGLSMSSVLNKTMSGYDAVSDRTELEETKFTGDVLNSFYDGVGETFICIEGKWYYKSWD